LIAPKAAAAFGAEAILLADEFFFTVKERGAGDQPLFP
jgi:hypothetical protein